MGKTNWKDFRNTLKWVGALFGTVMIYAASMGMYSRTLVEWWEPLSIALAVALLTWFVLRKYLIRLWKDVNVYLLLFGHLVVVTGVALFAVYGLNILGADEGSLHEEQVTVESRLRETHHHSQRVGRNRYRQGSAYYKYFFHVRFENGREKDIEVSLNRYNRTRTGSTVTLRLENGLLGYPVITNRL